MMKRASIAVVVLAATMAVGRDYRVFDVVGDSISAGVNPDCHPLAYGWVDMLFGESGCATPAPTNTITNLWPGITVYNSAVSGSTAKDWAWQKPAYLAAVSNHHPDLVVVFIGGNDGLAYAGDGIYTDAERGEFETNLTIILQKLRVNDPVPDVVVVDYYDLFDGFSTNLPPLYANYRALSPAVVQGNDMIRRIAGSNGCFFVDIYSHFLHHGYGEALGDTNHLAPDYVRTPLALETFDIHPVTAGHGCIYTQVWSCLLELDDIPRLLGVQAADEECALEWRSSIGQQYVIERADGPAGPFFPFVTNAGAPVCNTYTDCVSGWSRAFYRVSGLDRP